MMKSEKNFSVEEIEALSWYAKMKPAATFQPNTRIHKVSTPFFFTRKCEW